MFVVTWAATMMIIARIRIAALLNSPISAIGSQIACP
jgi:hypothetical protein